jgi:hypothetical protein
VEFASFEGLDDLPGDADALFRRAEQGNLFLSRPWFDTLIAAAVPDDQSLAFACTVDGEKVVAMLPLMRRGGDVWSSLSHRYTPHYSLLLADEDQEQALECLCDGLVTRGMDSLLLAPVAAEDRRLAALRQHWERRGGVCDLRFRFFNWVLRIEGQSFDEYLAGRPAQLRNTLARKSRKLAREHGYEVRIYVGADVPTSMADYHSVYDASWKANEQYRVLLDRMTTAFSAAGWSRLGVLSVDRKPVAAQLWFVAHGKGYIFRLAYDQSWQGYSPGSILTARMMEHVIEVDRAHSIDFLTGNETYKQDWMSERQERCALSCVYTRPAPRRLHSVLGTLAKALSGNR